MLSAPIVADLRDAVGADGLIIDRNQLQTYECDGLAVLRSLPAAVVLLAPQASCKRSSAYAPAIAYPLSGAAQAPGFPEERCPMIEAS